MKLVYVVWDDASTVDDGTWVDRKDAKPAMPTIFHQVGYLHALTPLEIVLTYCVGDDFMAPRSRIPIGMVRKLVELTEGEPVKIPKQRKARK